MQGRASAVTRGVTAVVLFVPYVVWGIVALLSAGAGHDADTPAWADVVAGATAVVGGLLLGAICALNLRPLAQRQAGLNAVAAGRVLVITGGLAGVAVVAFGAALVQGTGGDVPTGFAVVLAGGVLLLAWRSRRAARV